LKKQHSSVFPKCVEKKSTDIFPDFQKNKIKLEYSRIAIYVFNVLVIIMFFPSPFFHFSSRKMHSYFPNLKLMGEKETKRWNGGMRTPQKCISMCGFSIQFPHFRKKLFKIYAHRGTFAHTLRRFSAECNFQFVWEVREISFGILKYFYGVFDGFFSYLEVY
jgi:hypothetical protein